MGRSVARLVTVVGLSTRIDRLVLGLLVIGGGERVLSCDHAGCSPFLFDPSSIDPRYVSLSLPRGIRHGVMLPVIPMSRPDIESEQFNLAMAKPVELPVPAWLH
jgi:hypothetical protein